MARKRRKIATHHRYTRLTSQEWLTDIKKVSPYLQTNLPIVLKRLSFILCFIGVVLANTALVGAFAQAQIHNRLLSGFIIPTSTAICILFLSVATLLSNLKRKNILIMIFVTFVALVSILLSSSCLLIPFFHLQQAVFLAFHKTISVSQINLFFSIEPNTAFILMTLSLALIASQYERLIDISQGLVLFCLLILLPTNISYFYGSNFIYDLSTNTKLSLVGAFALDALAFAILFLRSQKGILKFFTQNNTGGLVARRFIFVTILTPLILGWLVLIGFNIHLYSSQFRFLLLISSSIVAFTIWAYVLARSFELLETNRTQIQDNILFLSEASKLLSSSLNYEVTLRKIALLAIPHFADWCAIEIRTPEDKIKLLTITHESTQKQKWAVKVLKEQLRSNQQNAPQGIMHVFATGQSELYPSVTDNMLKAVSKHASDLRRLRNLNISSVMIVPIIVERKVMGVMQFLSTQPTHHYSTYDLHIAQELASRAALAIENTRLYKNAQEAIKIRDEFLSIASHELKTPLTSLKVYTEVLERQFNKKDLKAASYLQKMDIQISSITNLIHDLLDVTRIQLGKLSFHFEKFSFGQMIKDVVDNFQLTALYHKIEIHGAANVAIVGDRQRLSQVILNLLTNAVKYSPDSDKVIVTLTQTPSTVSLAVTDFGIGIDKEHLGKVFDRFYQVGNKKQTNAGLGMGLYISREIVLRHGGTITVKSSKEKGTTFTVVLPVALDKSSLDKKL